MIAIIVVKDYIQATYARNFAQAYRLISIEDQRIRNEGDYVREQGAYDGFTLRLAKSLAEKMDFAVLEDKRNGQRARITARFKLPSPEDLSPLVQNWDSEKLNSIPPVQQRQILESIEKLRRDKKLLMVESQETFELIKEGKNWRLFFDWAGGTKVRFGFLAPSSQRDRSGIPRKGDHRESSGAIHSSFPDQVSRQPRSISKDCPSDRAAGRQGKSANDSVRLAVADKFVAGKRARNGQRLPF